MYVLCRTKCPEAHTFCNKGVTFITKRTGLLRHQEVGSFFVVVSYEGGLPTSVVRNHGIGWLIGELLRTPLGRSSENSPSTHSGE